MIKKLFKWLKSLDYRIKFLLVGGLNTVVGIGSYLLMLVIFGVNIFDTNTAPVHFVVIATLVSQVIGVIHSYLWNKFFTFEVKEKSVSETIRFLIVYLVVFGLEYALKLGFGKLGSLNQFTISIITTIVNMIVSFVGQKLFVFKFKNKKISKVESEQNEKEEV